MAFLAGTFMFGTIEASAPEDTPFLTGIRTAEDFSRMQNERLVHAQRSLDKMLSVRGARTVENTLQPYDDILIDLDATASQAGLLEQVHPDSSMRSRAEQFTQKAAAFANALSLNRNVYDALASIDISSSDQTTKFYIERTLRDFHLSGVDKDEPIRKKIKDIRDTLVEIGQDFSRNIRDDVRTVVVKNISELEGLPQDFIARHTPAPDGSVTLTINYPDAIPVFTYAKNEEVRKRMYMEFNNRAYPKNVPVLEKMISQRHALAELVGFPNFASYITADKMVATEKNAAQFIDRIAGASKEKSDKEYQMILARKKKDFPNAAVVYAWESAYWSELVRKATFDFDAQKIRPYFPYERVKQGVLDITSSLFGVTFQRNTTAPVWHASVECWDIHEGGRIVGRLYLDMHPRDNKYNHAAQFAIRNGVRGRQIPESALICNFPGGLDGDPGLMEHSDVVTFFHEFGHLLHSLFAGRQPWMGITGLQTEWDFVEVPSQLLEEWAWDPATLATFAKHYQTNEPISEALVKQMKRASEFGKALRVRQQMLYAKLSLSCYDNSVSGMNLDDVVKSLRSTYVPYPHVDGTHFQYSFGHLEGYSAIYYTYMWSMVIAKDLFAQFDRSNMLAKGAAKRYRETILAPGGSKPAAQLVRDFLGRDFSYDGWQKWLNEEE